MNRKHYFFTYKSGMTITEILTTLAIIAIMTMVGHQFYLYYYNVTSRLSALQHLGTQAVHKMQTCVEQAVLNTGKDTFEEVERNGIVIWKGCDSLALLDLQHCQDCSTPQLIKDGSNVEKALCIEITQGKFKQCISYKLKDTESPHKATVNTKVCVEPPTPPATSWSDASVSSVWPYRPCDSDSDCKTNQKCKKFLGECDSTPDHGGCG